MHAMKCDRMQLYAALEDEVSRSILARFNTLLKRRGRRIPAAYLTQHKEFFGLDFAVSPQVLIPRPETECLVERAVKLIKAKKWRRVYDIGTGCGNIAIAIVKTLPYVRVAASDVSEPALRVARRNTQRHRVAARIKLVKSNLATHIRQADLIIANLPYVPESEPVSLEALHEPRPAIFDPAPDGLGSYRQLFSDKLFGRFRGVVLIELQPRQYAPMRTWLRQKYSGIKTAPITNIDRQTWGLEADFSACGGESV